MKLLSFFFCLCVGMDCFANDTSRLLMVTKGNHTAFFLPLQHITSQVEVDSYLNNVIEKVFTHATVVYDESAYIHQIYSYAMLPCGNQEKISPKLERKLEEKYNEIKAYDEYKFPAQSILQEPEFAQIMLLLLGPVKVNEKKLPPSFMWHQGQITSVLAQKYGVRIESIEQMYQFQQSYCSLTSEEKTTLVEDVIQGFETPILAEPMLSQQYKKMLECMNFFMKSSSKICEINKVYSPDRDYRGLVLKEGTAKFLQNNRNSYWLKKIVDNSESTELPFYGLGIRHFFPNKFGPGLIEQLKKNDFDVRLIRTLKDVPKYILRRSISKSKIEKKQK